MAYDSRNSPNVYENHQEKSTISQIVDRDRYRTDNERNGTIAHIVDRDRNDNGRLTPIKSTTSPVQRENYGQRIPTTNVSIDPIRRPHHGSARSCVLEINIAVNLPGNRASRDVNVYAPEPTGPIRSTSTIEDAHRVNLVLQPRSSAIHLSTDGYLQRPTYNNVDQQKYQN